MLACLRLTAQCGHAKSRRCAAAADHRWFVWGVLLFASAGVFHHSGIKIPYFAFFAHDSGKRVKEAPWNMLLAMGLTAFLCIFIGVYPKALYDILPFPVDYVPYTTAHVITQLQLLMFSALAFTVLMLYKIYPPELKSTNLDTDWFYRKLFPCVLGWVGSVIRKVDRMIREEALTVLGDLTAMIERQHGDGAPISKTMQAGTMALIVLSILFLFLIVTLIA